MRVSIDDSILTDIADAIRDKKESTDTYAPQEMAQEISTIAGIIPTGTINITTNDTYDITNYASASVNVASDPTEYFGTSFGAGANGNYAGVIRVIEYLPDNYIVPSGTDLSLAFWNMIGLKEAPLFDTSSVTSLRNCFLNCSSLTKIPQYNTANVTNFSGFISNCAALTDVPILDMSSATNLQYLVTGSTGLSDTSINNILISIAGATNYTGTKTLAYIGFTTYTATAQEIQAMPNYQDIVDAGWTIGY